MPEFYDDTYGRVVIRRSRLSRAVKFSLHPKGHLEISAPSYLPVRAVKLLLRKSRSDVEALISNSRVVYSNNQSIGRSHKLSVVDSSETKIYYRKPFIYVELNSNDDILSPKVQQQIKKYVIKALKAEASAYLPRRVDHLASIMDISYKKLRFSHAKSRWGSCTSKGVITLNIALMKLEHEYIDYVIIHELAHIVKLNHSPDFWNLVKTYDPLYKSHRLQLKNYSPHV